MKELPDTLLTQLAQRQFPKNWGYYLQGEYRQYFCRTSPKTALQCIEQRLRKVHLFGDTAIVYDQTPITVKPITGSLETVLNTLIKHRETQQNPFSFLIIKTSHDSWVNVIGYYNYFFDELTPFDVTTFSYNPHNKVATFDYHTASGATRHISSEWIHNRRATGLRGAAIPYEYIDSRFTKLLIHNDTDELYGNDYKMKRGNLLSLPMLCDLVRSIDIEPFSDSFLAPDKEALLIDYSHLRESIDLQEEASKTDGWHHDSFISKPRYFIELGVAIREFLTNQDVSKVGYVQFIYDTLLTAYNTQFSDVFLPNVPIKKKEGVSTLFYLSDQIDKPPLVYTIKGTVIPVELQTSSYQHIYHHDSTYTLHCIANIPKGIFTYLVDPHNPAIDIMLETLQASWQKVNMSRVGRNSHFQRLLYAQAEAIVRFNTDLKTQEQVIRDSFDQTIKLRTLIEEAEGLQSLIEFIQASHIKTGMITPDITHILDGLKDDLTTTLEVLYTWRRVAHMPSPEEVADKKARFDTVMKTLHEHNLKVAYDY